MPVVGAADWTRPPQLTTKGISTAASGTLEPTPPNTPPYKMQIDFTAPTVPVPGSFTGTLIVAWAASATSAAGSASVALVGTTGSLTANVATGEPIKLTPGGSAPVPIKITYLSSDATTLHVDLAPAIFPAPPPTDLTIGTRITRYRQHTLSNQTAILIRRSRNQ